MSEGYIPTDWEMLAESDNSESYDVDITAIYRRPDGQLILATASGCSCWAGEYDFEEYPSLDAIEASFRSEDADKRQYTPSFAGADELMAQARAAAAA